MLDIEYHPLPRSGCSINHISLSSEDHIYGVPDYYSFERYNIFASFKDMPTLFLAHSFTLLTIDDYCIGHETDYHSFHSLN